MTARRQNRSGSSFIPLGLSSGRRLHPSSFASAFTLLELLIIIGIIALLSALLLLGTRSIFSTSKANATKITLQALQGMLAELDAKTQLSKAPQAWMWWPYNQSASVLATPPGATGDLDFWHIPFRGTGAAQTAGNPDSMDAPGLMSDDATRNAARQVLDTQTIMTMLLGLPTNRTMLQKIPTDRYFLPAWQVTTAQVWTPGADGVLNSPDDTVPPPTQHATEVVKYFLGCKVTYQGASYLWNSAMQGNASPPGGSWSLDTSPPTPVLLDAWDNPIIFVPATGLRVRLLNGASTYVNTDGTIPTQVITKVIISPEGKLDPTGTIVLQPGRPFFASAGPDGDFSKGDDNVYSFEQ